MPSGKVLLDLIRLAYESAADPHLWSSFLEQYAEAVKASAAAFIVQDLRNHSGSAAAKVGYDSFWERRYAEYYGSINVWTRRAPLGFERGKILLSQEWLSEPDLVKTEFYNDFLKPQDHFYSIGCAIAEESYLQSYIAAMRSRAGGEFGEAEATLLNSCLRTWKRLCACTSEYRGWKSGLAA
jgi:hypothetical protein